jgi:iron complex transport system substrate-binding protein
MKPRVSAFTSADIPKIAALEPDLVLAFPHQADIAGDLARAGLAVHVFNQRDLSGIFAMIRTVGALIGCPDKANDLARSLEDRVCAVASETRSRTRVRVYFEEWDDPMISGTLGLGADRNRGGDDIFAENRSAAAAKDRIVSADDVLARAPDVILASWCGRKSGPRRFQRVRAGTTCRPSPITAFTIKSPLILQPGPAALTDGLTAIRNALA